MSSGDSAQSEAFDARVLEQLACPVCFGELRLDEAGQRICCTRCLRVYPLIDGIPVLIAERALGSQGLI
jgi:uncharacterized protein YbaR (Trm112 family)